MDCVAPWYFTGPWALAGGLLGIVVAIFLAIVIYALYVAFQQSLLQNKIQRALKEKEFNELMQEINQVKKDHGLDTTMK